MRETLEYFYLSSDMFRCVQVDDKELLGLPYFPDLGPRYDWKGDSEFCDLSNAQRTTFRNYYSM